MPWNDVFLGLGFFGFDLRGLGLGFGFGMLILKYFYNIFR
jgi:hypothetical protein